MNRIERHKRVCSCRGRQGGTKGRTRCKRIECALLWSLVCLASVLIGNAPELRAADFTREQVVKILNAKEPKNNAFSNRDMTGLDLSGLSFAKFDLFGVNLRGSKLVGCDFSGANLDRARMEGANLTDANLNGASLYAAILDNATLTRADLTGTRMIGSAKNADFTGAKIVDADWGANPANQGMVPIRVDLTEADFSSTDVSGTNFVHAVLEYAKFREATAVGTRFDWAKLSGADLSGANTKEASFKNAVLDGTTMP